jgi:ABC-2 type transport system permease protein
MSAEALAGPRVTVSHRPGVATVYRWELLKLIVQKRTYIGIGAALLVPLIFIVALAADSSGGPDEIPFGRYVRETGLAIPLVSMSFGAIWLLPLITALVAGDIVSNEDHNGTLKTILTRSVERWHVFTGKLLASLTYTLVILVIYVGIGLVVGGLVWGFDPLTTLSGTRIGVGHALALTGAGVLAYFIPMIAMASIAVLLSTTTHNSAAAVVGTLMISILLQVLGAISALDWLHPYLLSEQFNAWQGLLREPADWDPVIRSVWVCALYGAPAAAAAFVTFVRRDVTGG